VFNEKTPLGAIFQFLVLGAFKPWT